jgi:putative transcriptional regulator
MSERNILGELMEGVAAMQGHREGKLTLRSYKVESTPLPKVDSKLIRDTRKRLHCSRAIFARKLRINEKTLEKWEQGRGRPNPQAAALVLLVRKYPDTPHSSAWIGLPPDRKLSTYFSVHWFTLRRVEGSMAKGGARDRVNADDGLLPGIRLC